MVGRLVITLLVITSLATVLVVTTSVLRTYNYSGITCESLPSKPVVATYYYVWYGDGLGGRHWNDSSVTQVVDEPLINYYSSINESVIEWQLRLIRNAGIDVLFISWWGPNSYEDRVAREVFNLLPKYGLKAALLIEPFRGSGFTDALTKYGPKFWESVLPYIEEVYIRKYGSSYFRLCGKPLILTFAPVGLLYLPRSSDYVFRVVSTHVDLLKMLGLRADWDLWPDYLAPWVRPRGSISLKVRINGYVAIAPRFDDRALCRVGGREGCVTRLLDPTYSLNAYVKEWGWVIKHCREVGLVAIYSWNEYHERSEIEPHRDATKSPNVTWDPYGVTREFIKSFKACRNALKTLKITSSNHS